MNTIQIVEVVKKVITDELLENVDGRHCVLDLCIEDYQNVEKLSKVSKSFLECNKDVLAKVYNSEKRLALRKYGYEKILNQYLEEEYGVHDIGSKFTSAVERIQETEERRHDEKVNNEILERDPDTTVREVFARELLQMYKDNSFHSTKFSTDHGYATSLDMYIYLWKEDIEEGESVMTAEYRPVEYGNDYDVVNNPDKFQLYIDGQEIE